MMMDTRIIVTGICQQHTYVTSTMVCINSQTVNIAKKSYLL